MVRQTVKWIVFLLILAQIVFVAVPYVSLESHMAHDRPSHPELSSGFTAKVRLTDSIVYATDNESIAHHNLLVLGSTVSFFIIALLLLDRIILKRFGKP